MATTEYVIGIDCSAAKAVVWGAGGQRRRGGAGEFEALGVARADDEAALSEGSLEEVGLR